MFGLRFKNYALHKALRLTADFYFPASLELFLAYKLIRLIREKREVLVGDATQTLVLWTHAAHKLTRNLTDLRFASGHLRRRKWTYPLPSAENSPAAHFIKQARADVAIPFGAICLRHFVEIKAYNAAAALNHAAD